MCIKCNTSVFEKTKVKKLQYMRVQVHVDGSMDT